MGPWICSKMAFPYSEGERQRVDHQRREHRQPVGVPEQLGLRHVQGRRPASDSEPGRRPRPYGIRVNCYGPTAIATNMVTDFIKQSDDPVGFEKA